MRVVTLLPLLWLVAPPASAQTGGGAVLRATVDRTEVTTADRIVLSLTVVGSQEGIPRLPPLVDFEVSQVGTSSQVQMFNGRTSASISYNYFLFPKKPGTFVIPPAMLEVGGTRYESQPITIKVVAEAARPDNERDLFITASVSNPRPFVGEQIVYSWRLHHRVRLAEARLEPFDFSGFQFEDLGEAREYETNVGGQLYRVHELKKALFPQQAGAATLVGPALDAAVVRQRRGGVSRLDEMLGRFETERRRVQAPPVAVEVRALPPAPGGFGGLVGQFKIDAAVSRRELATGQSTTLKITVSGAGNARLISEPRLTGLERFKVYDEKPQQSMETSGDEVRGRKVFTKSLVPLVAGSQAIPAATLVYFDPQAERYQTATSPALSLEVAEGGAAEDPRLTEALAPGGGKVGVTILADDILPIAKDLDALTPAHPSGLDRLGFFCALFLPPLLFAGLVWRQRREDRFAADRGLRRRLEALKRAQPLAAEALAAWQRGAAADAAALASRALRQFIGDKVGVEGGALTADEAARHLAAGGVSAEQVERVRALLADLEATQYRASTNLPAAAMDVAPLLAELEGQLSSRGRGRLITLLALLPLAALNLAASPPQLANSDPPEEIFVRANSAYEAGNSAEALELYQWLVARGFASGPLLYNLGNAALRNGELGRAIAAYRQAQRYSPRSSDLAANLAFARQSAKDNIAPPAPSKIASTLFFWHFRMSRGELAAILLVANTLLWLALALRLRRRAELLLWLAGAAAFVTLGSGVSLALHSLAPSRIAVVLPAEVEAKSSTDAKALTRFKLHAGSELRLEGQAGDWLRVALPDGEPGWLPTAAAQIVEP